MSKKPIEFFKVIVLFSFIFFSFNQISYAQDIVWERTENLDKSVLTKGNLKSSTYSLKVDNFEQKLTKITAQKTGVMYFPLGQTDQEIKFKIKETKVMHPDLARKFPNIKSYKGIALDGSKRTIQFTYSSNGGFFGVLENTIHEKVEIKPINNSLHEFINTSSQVDDAPFECQTEDLVRNKINRFGALDRNVDDGNLRRYRLALSVSGDYSQVFLDGAETNDTDRKAKVLQAMVNSVNRLNGIFERDFGVTMQLIANTDLLIFLNPLSDPYSSGMSLRNELVATINNTITNSDYDVGHLFHAEPNRKYGNAGCIACVCKNNEKGQAYSVHGNPDTDDMNLLAAHEFGHQFGAYHTQSSRNCRSGMNSEVEPGSGSTIMSYAGICPPNVQAGSDDYFNYTSIRDVAIWTIDNSSCAELIPNTNSAPIVSTGLDYIIPKSTPFVLEGSATDSDGNETLTYCWEQNDPEDPQDTNAPFSTRGVGPMFRSFPPSSSSKRYFPNLSDVIANNLTPTWEVLPSVSRVLNFVMTVRDNGIDGGQTVSDAITINVDGNAGPFAVTSQINNSEVWTVGDLVTVSWNVAGTSLVPINASQVEVLLSTDGGLTFPNSLIVTDNDGEETFNLPNVDATSNARILIKAVDNVFFAVNQQNFTIEKSEYAILSDAPSIEICDTDNAVFNLEYKTFLTFDEEVSLSVSNLPVGTNVVFTEDTFTGTDIEGTPFVVTLEGVDNLETGNYSFNVGGVSASNVQKSLGLSFNVFSANDIALNLISPANNIDSQELDVEFNWENDTNSISYQIDIATDDTFTNSIETFSTTNASYKALNLENNAQYYWRVQTLNPCGFSSFSDVYTFSTQCSTPSDFNTVNVDIDSIEVAWEDSASSTSWAVEFGESGFALGTGTRSVETVKQFKAQGLESGVKYDFYIKGNCDIGGSSSYIGPFTIKTHVDYCNGDHFYDSGGVTGNYQDNEFVTTQIYPEVNTDRIRVRFDAFDLHYGYDFLNVFNGESDTDTFLGGFTGTQLIGKEFVSTHESGALTFVFYSNEFITSTGWDATVTCEQKPNCFEPINFENIGLEGDEASFEWAAVGDDGSWELEYGSVGFIRGNGTTITSAVESVTIENLTPNTTYDIYIKTICDAGGFSEILGPYAFRTTELCSAPFDVNMTSFTNDTAEANWDNLNTGISNWQVEYGLNGFLLGSGTALDVTEKNVSIEGLNSNTDYQLYVRSNCESDGDGFSNWMGPVNFKTTPDYCNGDHFYDSGGPSGNYSNRENSTTVIYPKSLDERVRVVFNSFLVETCCDRLRVYDGPDTQSPLIGSYTSNPGMLVSTHESGALTFHFYSDGSSTRSGWDATVLCEDKPNCSAPNSFFASNVEAKQVDLSWQRLDSEVNWTIEYGLRDFILGDGVEVISNASSKTLTDLIPDAQYDAYIKTNCAIGGFSDVVGPVRFDTPVACFIPQNLAMNVVSTDTADIIWDAGISNESEWEIEYGTQGFLLGTGTKQAYTTNSASIENLSSNTAYDVYVRANCDLDGYSNWSFPFSFKTNCETLLAPYKESFVARNTIPDCWSQSANGNWNFNTYADWGASNVQDRSTLKNSNYAWLDGSKSAFNGDYILKSPWVDVSSLTNPAITCSVFSKNTINAIYNTLNVNIYDADGIVFTNVITVNTDTGIWKDFVIDLSDYAFTSTDIQVEFKITLNQNSSRRYNDVLIDEVSFDELPSCTNPINPLVSNISGRSAELSWDATDDETNWEIQYGFSGFTTAGATTKFITENPYVFTDLVPERYYDVYIRAVCGIGDSSEFIGPITFSTLELCPRPSNFRFVSSTKNTAQLSWDDVTDGAEWEVEYGEGFFSPGAGIVETTSVNSINIENLTPDMLYYVYLRRDCGVDDGNSYDLRIAFRTQVACTVPTGFRITTVTKNNAALEWDNNVDVTQWEVEYNAGYFNPGNGVGSTQASSVNSINIENLLPNTRYYVYLRSSCGSDGYSNWTGYTAFLTPIACSVPNGFMAASTTTNSALLAWDTDSETSQWEVEYSTFNFSPGNGTKQTAATNSIDIEDLNSNTTYYAYLRKNCGVDGFSEWSPLIQFGTQGDYCNGDHFYDSGGEFGNYFNNENRTTVITPESVDDRVKVTFDYLFLETCCDRLMIYDGPTSASPLIGSYSNLPSESIISTHESGALTFVFISNGNTTSSGWDATVACEPRPNCSAPINFTAINIEATEVEFSWEQNDSENNWTLEYGLQGFSLGSGTRIISNTSSEVISNLNSSTSYDIYIKTNCIDDGFSDVVGPLNFITTCDSGPNDDNLITNGSFECGSLAGWTIGGPDVFSGCSLNFKVFENSFSVCSIVDEISPTDGRYAAFTSFDGAAGTTYSLHQTINIPSNLSAATSAILSFDFKVNYRMTYNNPTQERVLTARFTDLAGVELFSVEELRFGLSPDVGSIDTSFNNDISLNLSAYAGETIVLNFEAFVPETSTGPAKALIDNVSLIVDEILSVTDNEFSTNKLMVYPIPNKGAFTVNNKNGGKIDFVEIFDMAGRLLQREKLSAPSKKVDVHILNVTSGVYFVKVRIDGVKYSKRIVVE